MQSTLLVAVDHGPLDALRPLADCWGTRIEGERPAEGGPDAWERRIRERGARAMICGTSDSAAGRSVEADARRAAAAAGIPVVAIEDFPGNYSHVPEARTALLVVESDAVAAYTRTRLGTACPRVEASSPARFDAYRAAARTERARTAERWSDIGAPRSLLWAGQPETEDALYTLRLLLPLAARHGITVLFKAHPRDRGYAAGAYRETFTQTGARIEDITDLSVRAALALAPRLVVTQFSSIGIEAGFYGIPSLSVLLPGAGGDTLLQKKGYRVPPYCEAGASAAVTHPAGLQEALAGVLLDRVRRESIIRCFDVYFRTDTAMLPALLTLLSAVGEIGGIRPEISDLM